MPKEKSDIVPHYIKRVAGNLKLYLHCEGGGWERKWNIYSTTSGQHLATYYPKTFRCLVHCRQNADFTDDGYRSMLFAVSKLSAPVQ